METINKVKRQINPKLKIEGILLTMVDSRTNYSKDISNLIRESYGGKLKVYKTDIPRSVRAEEISAEGTSIFKHDPKGKVAEAYKVLTKEVLNNAEKRRKHQLEGCIASKIARQEEVVEHNKQMKAHVYEDFKTEMITREEYFIFKAEFDKNIQEAKEAIARLVGNKNQISSGLTEQQSWLAQFREYENIQELNRRVVVNFIDRIEITEDKQVHVVLNNADQFQAIMEFLEEEKAKADAKKVISFIREVS